MNELCQQNKIFIHICQADIVAKFSSASIVWLRDIRWQKSHFSQIMKLCA